MFPFTREILFLQNVGDPDTINDIIKAVKHMGKIGKTAKIIYNGYEGIQIEWKFILRKSVVMCYREKLVFYCEKRLCYC